MRTLLLLIITYSEALEIFSRFHLTQAKEEKSETDI